MPSVTFIVAANIDSKKETTGLLISPTFESAIANIIMNTIIGIMSPDASASIGLAGMMLRKMSPK